MTQADRADGIAPPARRPGRRRDHTRDPKILDAALQVLAETGFDGMTIDMVAARARAGKATLYRRWPSKAELVIDAVAGMTADHIDQADLPDTGTLRGDLIAMIKPHTIEEGERKMRIMAGLMSMLSRHPELGETLNAAIVEPRAAVTRMLLRRAVDRGEIPPDCDIETLALITPSMVTYRTLVLKKPVTRPFLTTLIDHVLLPAVGISAFRGER